MPEIATALRESVEEVLERMFFIECLGESPEPPAEPELSAWVSFQGDPSGDFLLRITTTRARSAAADFLGLDPSAMSEGQWGEVVCEMANMICGSVLSRMEASKSFRLAAPRSATGEEKITGSAAAGCVLEIEQGQIAVTMSTEIPGWGKALEYAS